MQENPIMTENDRQFDDLEQQVSDRLCQDLRGRFEPPSAVPARVDKIILDQAKQRLAKPGRLIIRLRWAAGIAAAAAVVTVGVILLNPQSAIMSPPASTGGRNPQSIRPALAESRADIDGNGRVDILDAFRLARSIEAHGPADPQWDLNGDGRIDKDDVDLVARAAVRLGPEPQAHRGEGILPLRVAGILPAIRGREALDTKEQGQDGLATQGRDALATNPLAALLGMGA
jgi:hypothetical protein